MSSQALGNFDPSLETSGFPLVRRSPFRGSCSGPGTAYGPRFALSTSDSPSPSVGVTRETLSRNASPKRGSCRITNSDFSRCGVSDLVCSSPCCRTPRRVDGGHRDHLAIRWLHSPRRAARYSASLIAVDIRNYCNGVGALWTSSGGGRDK